MHYTSDSTALCNKVVYSQQNVNKATSLGTYFMGGQNNQEKWLYIQTLVLKLKPGQLASSLLDGLLLLAQV